MQLTDEAMAEFQALHQKYFGYVLDPASAEYEASKLIRLVALIQPKVDALRDDARPVE